MILRGNPRHRTTRLVMAVATLSLLVSAVIIMVTPKAVGYELSTYDSYPWPFWVSIVMTVSLSVYSLIHMSFSHGERDKYVTISAILTILVANTLVLLIPLLRGYYVSNLGDDMTHMGMTADIIASGHIGPNDYYPSSHILTYELGAILHLDIRIIQQVIPSLFYVLFFVGIFLLSTRMSTGSGETLLVISFASVLLFGYFCYLFLPTQFALHLAPLVLYLAVYGPQRRDMRADLVLVTFLVLLPFLHPLGCLFTAVILVFLYISRRKNGRTGQCSTTGCLSSLRLPRTTLYPILILTVLFLAWFSNFMLFSRSIHATVDWLASGYGTPPVESLESTWRMSGMNLGHLAVLAILTYGPFLLLMLASVICIVAVSTLGRFRKHEYPSKVFLSMVILFFSALYGITLFSVLTPTGYSPRILFWAALPCIILTGKVTHEIACKLTNLRFAVFKNMVFTLIVACVVLGILGIFPSPHIGQANPQATHSDWSGSEWLLDAKGPQRTMCTDQFTLRSRDALLGYDGKTEFETGDFALVPERLGYIGNLSLFDSYEEEVYVVVGNRTREVKHNLWPDNGLFFESDLFRLELDQSVDVVFSNGGLDIYFVTK